MRNVTGLMLDCKPQTDGQIDGQTDKHKDRQRICYAVLTLGGSVFCGSEDPVSLDSSYIYTL